MLGTERAEQPEPWAAFGTRGWLLHTSTSPQETLRLSQLLLRNVFFNMRALWSFFIACLSSLRLLRQWIHQCLHAKLLTMNACTSYSPLPLSINSVWSSNSNKKQALLSTSLALFTHTLSPPLHTHTYTKPLTFINTSQVSGIMQKMGKSREKLCPRGLSVHYGLVNDRICPQEKVSSSLRTLGSAALL